MLLEESALKKLSFGVFLPFYAFQGERQAAGIFERLRSVVLECERLGYHSVWLDDHLMFGEAPLLECWMTLSALASVTTSIRLGTMVTSAAFRNPALLAKMAAAVDVISGGRLEFGVGAGIQKEEHIAYGFPFSPLKVRVERMKEAVEIVKQLWTQEKVTYKGKHFRLTQAVCEPKPIQKPHPPITIAGCGEKYTLKVTAQLADRFDFGYLPSLEDYSHKLQVLENRCKTVGRDFEEIEKSCWPAGQLIIAQNRDELEQKILQLKPQYISREDFLKHSLVGTRDDCVQRVKTYSDLGVKHFMLFFGDLPDVSGLRLFAESVTEEI
jgi:F420-dependent oxidoreductase-like protein